ncbi:PHD finger protein 7-like isoform X1 [Gallus gallus]|uniref:PHD finger protein 7-like isoform X1 n=1 Tax=Gallus gallus TaxID=9031 RepID=UPI001AE55FB3|nr:PHD finger protein 7-like isoform X1 [Gallus gallus]
MDPRSQCLSAPQASPSTSHSAARRRARATPEREPSPPKEKQRVSEDEGECRASPEGTSLCHVLVSPCCHAWGDIALVLMAGCGLCKRTDYDPEIYGETCRQDRLCVHENCLYHASGLYQHGADDEGFFGFLLPDIEQTLQRVAEKVCCVCRRRGASVRCHRRRCSRTFHYPCGRERGCVSQFFGEYRSFCWQHRPTQQVQPLRQQHPQCAICLEAVEGRPSYNTLICPSCTSAHFHRHCIQGQALRAALHHFRCPLCQDMQTFQAEMFRLGIKIPDRDAAWEEEGAFNELYQRHNSCDASLCLCSLGRDYSNNTGPWRMLLCSSCASCGTHQRCSAIPEDAESWECSGCSGVGTAPSVSAPAQ